MSGWLKGVKEYRIYIVGSFDELGWPEIYDGFREHWDQNLIHLNEVPIDIEFLDWSDLQDAVEIANDIALKRDVLAVIGHGSSSASKIALPVYMSQEPKIPVILVTETNPDLLPRHCDEPEMPCPVLRLSPTDDDQAETAVEFSIFNKCMSFGVVRDSSNPVYGNYLSDKIVSSLHEWGAAVMMSTESSNVSTAISNEITDIDCFFFIGRYYNALTLIRQTKQFNAERNTTYILSDSSAVPELIESPARIDGVNDVCVFLTHPRSANEIGNKNIGYKGYGLDAAWIMERLTVRANELLVHDTSFYAVVKRWLGIRRVSDARQALGRAMIQLPGIKGSPSKRDYFFDRRGHILEEKFHVWRLRDNKPEEVEFRNMQYMVEDQKTNNCF